MREYTPLCIEKLGVLRNDVNVGENAPSEHQPMATEVDTNIHSYSSMRSKVCFHATTFTLDYNAFYISLFLSPKSFCVLT